jgi:hypothetical protein
VIYRVFSLDVSADCPEHGCPCIIEPGTLRARHDDDGCQCHEDMNDRHQVGTIEIADTQESDSEIIGVLIDRGYLTAAARDLAVIDDCNGMGEFLTVEDSEGRQILMLEAEL